MVVVSVIFIIIINALSFDVIIPELSETVHLLTAARGKFEEAPTGGCKCRMKSWRDKNNMVSILNLTLPWLNLTTMQDLRQRHPNLPLELLYGAKNRRCSLLPTIYRYSYSIVVPHRSDSIAKHDKDEVHGNCVYVYLFTKLLIDTTNSVVSELNVFHRQVVIIALLLVLLLLLLLSHVYHPQH